MMPQRPVKPGKSAVSPPDEGKGNLYTEISEERQEKEEGKKKKKPKTTTIIIMIIMIIIFNEGGRLAIAVFSRALNNFPTRLEHTKHA